MGENTREVEFCDGHSYVFSSAMFNFGTNKTICLTCGKEIKPKYQGWKVKNKSMGKYYKLTSGYALYFQGKAEILQKGSEYKLAGLELSSFGDRSPFHYKDDIIRLPHSILEEIGTRPNKVEKIWELSVFFGKLHLKEFKKPPTDDEVLDFHTKVFGDKKHKLNIKLNLYYRIIDNV